MEGPPKNYGEFPHLIVFNLTYFGEWPDHDRFVRFHAFEDALYELLEDTAFHPIRIFFGGGKRWYVYARDRDEYLARTRSLVEEFADCWASTDGEYDPKWRVFREFERDYLTTDAEITARENLN